ncbi:hypothetical protein DICVIV_10031 [Dictyocaulus viviparus]|uniref:Uncharacterized protein n=1 Tax=Dictyocaulus viviparus TaxID=29172 RepID=A0A0D8XJL7_DICVI|nr:hypothetical protein DICVIV_10031 [Dictyocaulus viviparus]
MAVCQVIYNIIGTVIFYLIPWTRRLPIFLAKRLGEITDEYRWFIVVFIIIFFILLPAIVIGLTLLPDCVIVICFSLLLIVVLLIVILSVLQKYTSGILPPFLRTWQWVPVHLRSLQPYDRFMASIFTSIPLVSNFFKKPRMVPYKKSDRIRMSIKFKEHTQV